ncbi:hypothetical protein PROFUN_07376 [Planoprotostelium fungivorum]|uniref:Actin binding protein n=1 Tax=Planoprotostelium fungivorum TaxID=1890364 RepID=A0A2P6MTF2_9EUKA|nr:hypothetical protein PROFUN_07376 [Planoprotostelium fungivorum]
MPLFGSKKDKEEKKEDKKKEDDKKSATLKRDKSKGSEPAPAPEASTMRKTSESMPDQQRLDALFKQVLVSQSFRSVNRLTRRETEVPADMQAPMLHWDNKRKWDMIKKYKSGLGKSGSEGGGTQKKIQNTPQFFVEALKLSPNVKVLNNIRNAMKGQPAAWLKEFIELRGLEYLVALMHDLEVQQEKSVQDQEMIAASLRCLGFIMTSETGLHAVIRSQLLPTVALNIDTQSKNIRLRVLEIMSMVCSSSEAGHNQVLTSFSHVQKVKREEARFQTLVAPLKGEEVEMAILMDTMVLINTMINTTKELEDRIALRGEFQALGLEEVFKRLDNIDKASNLETQVQIFLEENESDQSEVKDAYANMDIDIDDPVKIVKGLQRMLKGAPEMQNMLAIMRNLLRLSMKRDTDSALALKSFIIMEKFTRGVCLQKENIGFDADTKITLNALLNAQEGSAKMVELNKQVEELKKYKDQNQLLVKELNELKLKGRGGGGSGTGGGAYVGGTGNGEGEGVDGDGTGTGTGTGGDGAGRGDGHSSHHDPIDGESLSMENYSSSLYEDGMAPPPAPPMPPPPPGMQKMSSRSLTGAKPTRKMRMINWTKIPSSKLEGTIWEELESKNDEEIEKNIDFDEMESLFSTEQPQEEEKKVSENAVVTVVDSKKAQNVGIVLSRLHLTKEQVREAILRVDGDVLDGNTASQLANYAPTSEDFDNIAAFENRYAEASGPRPKLSSVDQMFETIRDIPRVKERLRCMNIRETLAVKILEMKHQIQLLCDAGDELRNSPLSSGIIQLILRMGNFVNSGTFRGAASGFKIDILGELWDMRSAKNPQLNFMIYLWDLVDQKFSHLQRFAEEIPSVYSAARLSFPTLMSDVKNVQSNLDLIQSEIKAIQNAPPMEGDLFLDSFENFYEVARQDADDALQRFEKGKENFQKILRAFGEDSTMLPEDFFGIWVKFLNNFERAGKEVRKKRAAEENKRKREERRRQREEANRIEDEEVDESAGEIMEQLREGGVRVVRKRIEGPKEETTQKESVQETPSSSSEDKMEEKVEEKKSEDTQELRKTDE